MPRHRTLKSMFIDMIVFVGMFALIGHLSMNFWERFVIQTELTNMKTSLHSLKETIHIIGHAYDNLHREILGLAEIAEKKQTPKGSIDRTPGTPQSKKKQYIDKVQNDHKIHVEVIKNTINHTTSTAPLLLNKTIQNVLPEPKKSKPIQKCINEKCGKNMSTITKYPAKSTGAGSDTTKCKIPCPNAENCKYRKSSSGVSQCCNSFECYNPVYSWKF